MFIVFMLLVFFGMFCKKSKWYNFLIIIFIATITYLGENVADLENYQRAYNHIANGNFYNDLGIGWYYLCQFSAKLNLTYIQFKTILVVISIILINNSISFFMQSKYNKPIIWVSYLIFPLLLDCIQIRFFIAEAIVLFAMRYLISNKKIDIIKYILFVLMASTIHSSVLIYLIFLLYKVLGRYESKYIAIMAVIMILFLVFKQNIIKLCSLFINEQRINRYFYSTDALGIKGIIIYVCIILVFCYISKMILKKVKSIDLNNEQIKFYEFNNKLNILISIVLVFSIFDPNFFRLQRIMWVLLYISVAKLLNNEVKDIVILNVKIPLKLLTVVIAIIGNLIFISITTPEIIECLLL